MNRNKIAYLAGAIDADGTLGIKKSTYAVRVTKDSKQPSYSERVALRQVGDVVPKLLKKNFGGSFYITKPSAKRGQHLFSWAVTDMKAASCIRALLPFLLIKKNQAKNCLALRSVKNRSKKARVSKGRGHAGSSPRNQRHSDSMETLYQNAKHLNSVGI